MRIRLWCAAAAALLLVGCASPPAVTTLGWVGDSLTFQDGAGVAAIQSLLSEDGIDSTHEKVDGLIGRSVVDGVAPYIPSSQAVIKAWRSAGYHPNTWVIALCSNDFGESTSTLRAHVNSLLDLIVADSTVTKPLVIWVGPITQAGSIYDSATYRAQVAMMRTTIPSVLAGRTDVDGRFYDIYPDISRTDASLWKAAGSADGRHMSVAGYTLRNMLINNFIKTQLGAA
jgi:hypothetical protein